MDFECHGDDGCCVYQLDVLNSFDLKTLFFACVFVCCVFLLQRVSGVCICVFVCTCVYVCVWLHKSACVKGRRGRRLKWGGEGGGGSDFCIQISFVQMVL